MKCVFTCKSQKLTLRQTCWWQWLREELERREELGWDLEAFRVPHGEEWGEK